MGMSGTRTPEFEFITAEEAENFERKVRHVVVGGLWIVGGCCTAAAMVAWTVHWVNGLG